MSTMTNLNKRRTILVIEDDPGHAELIIRGLSSQESQEKIQLLNDGEKAVQFLFNEYNHDDQSVHHQIGLILLDLRLPRIDGLEILKRLKQTPHYRLIPVVILSTSTNRNDIQSAYDNYANSYLIKPASFEKFNSILKDVHNYWMHWNQTMLN